MEQVKVKINYFTCDSIGYSEKKIQELINQDGKILKDTNRSFVKLLEIDGRKIIIKNPIEKNKRKWMRFLTLFRKSEVIRALEAMEYLNKNEIVTNIPILAIEYRKFGMVFDSYMFYEYLSGEEINIKDSKFVIELIEKIHNLGYLHGDTQMRNFLNQNGKIVTIDSTLKKTSSSISKNLEYIGFAVDINEAYNYIDKRKFSYRIASFLYELFRSKRRLSNYLKNNLRQIFSKKKGR